MCFVTSSIVKYDKVDDLIFTLTHPRQCPGEDQVLLQDAPPANTNWCWDGANGRYGQVTAGREYFYLISSWLQKIEVVDELLQQVFFSPKKTQQNQRAWEQQRWYLDI